MKNANPPLETRVALEDALLDYLYAVDGLSDLDEITACFTSDAVLDLTGLNLGKFEGAQAIRGFYGGVFETMSHHMHTLTNFRVTELGDDTASCHAYVCGMGRSVSGVDVQVYVYYSLEMRRMDAGWKISHFYEAPQLLMPDSVAAAHNA